MYKLEALIHIEKTQWSKIGENVQLIHDKCTMTFDARFVLEIRYVSGRGQRQLGYLPAFNTPQ